MQVHPIRSTTAGRPVAAVSAITALALVLICSGSQVFAAKAAGEPADLTKEPPTDTKKSYNLGPTGALGWMHVEKAMTEKSRQILVTAVEAGSPAAGKLEVGDVILGVFGQPFAEDARKCFGRAIGQAETEAAGGRLPLTVWRKGNTQNIDIKLQVMGSYSETSPYNCPKARKILDQGLAVMAKNIGKENSFHINELALLASGKPEYLEVVRKSAQAIARSTPDVETLWQDSSKGGMKTWGHGYNNLFLCEYYLATGDKSVLPAIRAYTATIARGQGFFGTWGHGYVPPGYASTGTKDRLHGPVPPYGPVNATGLPCLISLILADKCAIQEPELKPAIARSNKFFGYYMGKGFIPYGEHRPGIGHDDNGKTSMTAMAFALQGKQPETHFFSKMVTASYESREWGHTGNGFSYLWGPIAANCGGPKAMAAFMKELRWYYDLARRWDGAFVNVETGGGTASSYHGMLAATGCYMLGYAAPLKKTALTGRYSQPANWLSDADISEAIAAERWLGDNAHAKRTTQQLLAGLGSWSPLDRARSAEELGRRKDDVLPQLLEMTRGKNPNARLGAVNAIGELKGRAAPALDTLAKLLNDDDRWLRVQTAEALRNIGADAKPVLPQMLKATAVQDETDQMQFAVGALSYALFYPGGAYGPSGILSKSVDGVSKDLLYPAIRSVAINPDSAARGCLRSTYTLFTLDDVQALAPEIVASIETMAPANTMFSKGVRLAGIQMMARLKIEEGIPLTIMLMNIKDWGKGYIIQTSLDVLKQYRGAAKAALPDLKKLAADVPKKMNDKAQAEHDKLLKLIELIETDTTQPKLVSLKAYLNPKKP
jgi:HEAT repeat protein